MSMSLMNRVQSTENYGVENGVKMVVYALAGTGKTVLCSTCPSPIILSAESGLLSLAGYRLPFIEIKTLNDLRDVYQWARSSNECRQNFQTLCLDSVSEIAETILGERKAKTKDGRMAYGEMIDEVTKVIKEFRDLKGYHVYMSAKQERIKNEATGVITAQPMMPGNKLGQAIPYFPDELFQLTIEQGPNGTYRALKCQPGFDYDAKDRSGALDAVEEPNLGKIIAKITLAQKQRQAQNPQ